MAKSKAEKRADAAWRMERSIEHAHQHIAELEEQRKQFKSKYGSTSKSQACVDFRMFGSNVGEVREALDKAIEWRKDNLAKQEAELRHLQTLGARMT